MNQAQRRADRLNRDRLDRQLARAADPHLPVGARKKAARYAAALAERLGLIERPRACPWCRRRLPLDRHHFDHSRPTEVIMLCKACHEVADGMSWSEATA